VAGIGWIGNLVAGGMSGREGLPQAPQEKMTSKKEKRGARKQKNLAPAFIEGGKKRPKKIPN